MSEEKFKCEQCKDTGFYGDNGAGVRGNREYAVCECRTKPTPAPATSAAGEWTPQKVKAMLDSWGRFTDLPMSEYERIANEHNADLNATLENIWELAAKAQAMRDVPNEHERRLYEAIEAARSRAAVKERGEDTKLREKWERELLRSSNVSGRSAYSYIEEFLQDLSQQ
jgi:hypothetical protein